MESDPTSGRGRDSAPHTHLRSQKHPGRSAPFERRIRVFCLLIAAPAFVVVEVELLLAVLEEVQLPFGFAKEAVTPVGGVIPTLRMRSRRASMMAT